MARASKPRRQAAASSKNGHDRICPPRKERAGPSREGITLRLLAEIRPSPENDKLYKPVSRDDPAVLALAASIRDQGVLEPLAITQDGFILSGHRRFVAAEIAGLEAVPCREEPILHDDPNFMRILREHNRQREKSFDEVMREEIVSTNPDEAYASLLQYREEVSRVKIATGVIEDRKHRSPITKAKKPFLNAIEAIIERLRSYWPLSVRLIHYQLLNVPPLIHVNKPKAIYCNNQKSYKALTELVTRARVAGIIPFEAIHDPTRPVTTWRVFQSHGLFVRRELDGFLRHYQRDLQQSQPCHLEILGEKNTVAGVIRPVAADYTIPFTLGRGYSSLPPRHAMAERFHRSGKDKMILLVLSDFDPEGQDIAHSFARSMRDDFGIEGMEFIKVAPTPDQVRELRLPPGAKAKAGSSRRSKFVREHGEHVYELEAVEPDHLQLVLRQAIESVLDMDLFRAEQAKEREDATYLESVRKVLNCVISDLKLN